jgi:hypothetical protein
MGRRPINRFRSFALSTLHFRGASEHSNPFTRPLPASTYWRDAAIGLVEKPDTQTDQGFLARAPAQGDAPTFGAYRRGTLE